MPKRIQPLSDIQVKNAKAAPKESKLFDGGGLFLLITPTGGKLWQFKYRFGGKMIAAAAMTMSSVSVISNALRLRKVGI